MKVFALDTALGACSAALLVDGVPKADQFDLLSRGHAEVLMSMVAQVEREAGLQIADVDRLAVTIGPGTFTGVRVGLSVAKAMALALDKPLVGISTLQAIASVGLAENTNVDAVAVAIDARRSQLYFQLFEQSLTPVFEPQAISPLEAADILRGYLSNGRLVQVLGSGASLVGQALSDPLDRLQIDERPRQPRALEVAKLANGIAEVEIGGRVDPLYLRPPDAKAQSPSRFAKGLQANA